VASGNTIKPFASTYITDTNFQFEATAQATITVSDNGTATDADGILSGPGLSKTGTGTYAVTNASFLQGLVFTPTAVAPGASRTTNFNLIVTDLKAGLSDSNDRNSVLVEGPSQNYQPLIAGTWGPQTLASGATDTPLSGVTISDTNPNANVNAKLSVSGGTLSGSSLIDNGNGTYSTAARSPQVLTQELQSVVFTPAPLASGQASQNFDIRMDISDGIGSATDTQTVINEVQASAVTPCPRPRP
jgi:hypothetical protein